MDIPRTVTEVILTNGTVGCETETFRLSATNIDGDPAALLQELNRDTPPMSWVSRGSWDTALKTVGILPISEALKAGLCDHVRNTGYLEDPAGRLFRLVVVGKSRGFAGDGIACWGTFTATAPWIIPNLIQDYLKALQTRNQYLLALPFESKEIRDRVLEAIADCPEGSSIGGWGELPAINEMRASLIKTVTLVGYVT